MRAALAVAAAVALGGSTAAAKAPTLREVQRDVTVVAFWATTCAPCRVELPMVAALQKRLAGDATVRVVAVSIDDKRDRRAAEKMATRLGVAPPLLVDAREYVRLFGGGDVSVPRLAVFDRAGAGLERNGARAGETSEDFVREVTAAVDAVRTHAATRPSLMWQPLHAR